MLPSINSVILPRGRGQKLYEHPVFEVVFNDIFKIRSIVKQTKSRLHSIYLKHTCRHGHAGPT